MLNSNAKVEGLAFCPGAQADLIKYLIDQGYGIIQLPCPEMYVYGCKRWGHVQEQLDTVHFRKMCRKILEPVVEQIVNYAANDYEIKALIGIDYSPSCGVKKTCSSGKWGGELDQKSGIEDKIKDITYVNGQGIFIQELTRMLAQNNLEFKFIGLSELDSSYTVKSLKGVL